MRRRILATVTALTVLAGPAAAQAAKKSYRAEVRRTTGGWAHVKANDYGSLGFVAGYNAYLRRTGPAKLPDPTCRGKRWVRPITALDMYRRFYQLGLRASSGNFLDEIVAARPPTGGAAQAARLEPHA